MEHTTGPWRTTTGGVIDNGPSPSRGSDYVEIAEVRGVLIAGVSAAPLTRPLDPQATEADANARLIAAAPDLLEACRQIVWKLSHDHQQPDGTFGPGKIDRRDATVRMAVAAIAKATE